MVIQVEDWRCRRDTREGRAEVARRVADRAERRGGRAIGTTMSKSGHKEKSPEYDGAAEAGIRRPEGHKDGNGEKSRA